MPTNSPTGSLAPTIRSLLLTCLSCVGVGGGCGAPDPHPPRQTPNILLITVDTLRADHTSLYGYARDTTPELMRYFADAERFERAYTAASYTSGSVVSLLTGLYPPMHGVRGFYQKLAPDVRVLPEYLRAVGYQTAAVVSNTVLTEEALGISSRFDHYDDFVDERELNRPVYERRASRTTERGLKWLAELRSPERPHFLWLHYMDPHAPYIVPGEEREVRYSHDGEFPLEPSSVSGYQQIPGVLDGLTYVDGYDEEIAYTDREVGRFLEAYGQMGLLEDAVLIFTSDHGETLLEHAPYFEHSMKVWDEVVRVPLLVRWPGRGAMQTQTPVSLVDLVPSLLEMATGSAPGELQGVPFRSRRDGDLIFQDAWSATPAAPRTRLRSVVRSNEKWTFSVDEKGRVIERAHVDLREDPREERKPVDGRSRWPEGSGPLREALREVVVSETARARAMGPVVRGKARKTPKVTPGLAAHQEDALRALGYIK